MARLNVVRLGLALAPAAAASVVLGRSTQARSLLPEPARSGARGARRRLEASAGRVRDRRHLLAAARLAVGRPPGYERYLKTQHERTLATRANELEDCTSLAGLFRAWIRELLWQDEQPTRTPANGQGTEVARIVSHLRKR